MTHPPPNHTKLFQTVSLFATPDHGRTDQAVELARLRAVVDNIAEGVVVADTNGNLLEWNPAALRMHGYTSADEVRRHFSTFSETFVLSPPGQPPLPHSEWPIPRLMRGESVADYEVQVRRIDTGIERIIRCNGKVVPNPDGGAGLVILTLHDMTERRRAEAETRRIAELLRAVADVTTDAVFVKDRDGKYLLFNEAASRFVGRPVAEVLGKDDSALFDQASARIVMERDKRVMESGRVETDEERLTAAGISRIYQATKGPYRDTAGNVLGLIGISRDITERKRAEEALVLFRALIDRTTDGIEVIDPETGALLDANETACLAHGYTREEYLRLRVADIDPLLATRPWAERIEEWKQTGFPAFESQHRRKDGSIFPVEVNLNLIQLEREYLVAVVRDITERKLAEQALRDSETRSHAVWENAHEAMRLLDENGTIVAVNAAFCRLFDMSREEVVGQPFTITYAIDRDPVERQQLFRERVRQRILAPQLERRMVLRSGEVVDLEITTTFIEQPGRPTYVLGLFRNITARKRSEEALRREREFIRLVLDTDPNLIFVKDATGRFLLVNKALADLYGTTPENLVGQRPGEGLPAPKELPEYRRIEQEVLNTGRSIAMDETNTRADGMTRWFNTIKVPLALPDGTTHLVGIAADITERKQAVEALRQAQERLQSVISSSPAVLFTLTVEEGQMRQIAWMSENVRSLLGYSPEETTSRAWWTANMHPEDRERVMANTDHELFANDRVSNEYRFRHRDGQYRWVRNEMRLVRTSAGQPVEVVGSWSDITEQKHIEEQFRQSQKMEAVGRLAGGVAHDFNNLLTIINGYADLLKTTISPKDPNHTAIKEIRNAGERAAGLTAQLLAFSRKAIIEPKILDLNEVVSQSTKLLRRLIGEDITLAAVLASGLARVKVDPGQIEQVVMNLAVNARDAMPTGGRLTFETRTLLVGIEEAAELDLEPGRYVRLTVTDTGVGMTDDVKARVFEPFFTTKEAGKGTGLGLAMVYGIVKTYRGHIGVESEPGAGTTFTILLPALADASPTAPKSAERAIPKGTETVLLVEDEAGVRGVAKLALTMQGYTVLEASSGAEAIRVAERHTGLIHILVTDVVMPGMNGRAVAETLRQVRTDIKVLYMSGYTDDAVVRHGIVEARDAFLQKPFTPHALARKVRSLLDGIG